MSGNSSDCVLAQRQYHAVFSLQPTQCLYVSLTVCCVCLWYSTEVRSRDVLSRIPGPPCLPVIGSVLSVGTRPHLAFMRFWRRYGDVFRIQIGSIPVVVLNGIQTIRTATVEQGDVFSGRPGLLTFKLTSEGKSMTFNSYSQSWKIHRRLAERALRLISGEGRFLQRVVIPEAETLAETLIDSSQQQARYNPVKDIVWSAAHVMYSMCYGNSRRAPDFTCMIRSILRLIECHKLGNAVNFFPWARRLLKNPYKELRLVCDRIVLTTKSKEEEHLETYQEGELRDSMDALIRLGVRRRSPLDIDQVLHTVQEFIGAGLDIISISLSWAVLYAAKYREKREKMLQEIDSVLAGRTPTEDDLKNLPYTSAFILETLRRSCVVPMTLPHETMTDTVLNGYDIPAGTMVLINICSIQWDTELWPDPESFRPERFIDSTGQLDSDQVTNCGAFGFGRRRCIGEKLGKQQLMAYMVTLLQRCTFLDDVRPVSEESSSGIVLQPQSFQISVKARC